jgi:hypothetical protein
MNLQLPPPPPAPVVLALPAPARTLPLAAPAAVLTVDRKTLGDLLRAVPKDATPVLVGSGDAQPALLWSGRDGVTQGRRLYVNRAEGWGVAYRSPLPVEHLVKICRLCKAAELTLHVREADKVLVVEAHDALNTGISSRWELKLPRAPRDVALPPVGAVAVWVVGAAKFLAALQQAAAMVPPLAETLYGKLSRYRAIRGVKMILEPSGPRLLAIDRRRLISVDVPGDPKRTTGTFAETVLPAEAIGPAIEFCKALGEYAQVAISRSPEGVILLQDPRNGDLLAVPEQTGDFPKVDDCLPDEYPLRLVFDRTELAKILTVAIRLQKEDGEFPSLRFEPHQKQETCRLSIPTNGGPKPASFDLRIRDCTGHRPGAIRFCLNPRYVEDFLRKLDKTINRVAVEYHGPGLATVWRAEHAFYVLMPITDDSDEPDAETPQSPPEPAETPATASEAPAPAPKVRTPRPKKEQPAQVTVAAGTDHAQEREPCIDCGTTGGGRTSTGKIERSKGRCQSCYNRFRRQAKEQTACCA